MNALERYVAKRLLVEKLASPLPVPKPYVPNPLGSAGNKSRGGNKSTYFPSMPDDYPKAKPAILRPVTPKPRKPLTQRIGDFLGSRRKSYVSRVDSKGRSVGPTLFVPSRRESAATLGRQRVKEEARIKSLKGTI